MIEAKQFRIMFVVVVAIAVAILLNAVLLPSATGQVSVWRISAFSSLNFTQPISNIEVDGDYAYLGVDDHMVIMDVSDPLAPIELGETGRLLAPYGSWKEDYQCRGRVSEVAVSGNFVYVAADTGGIQIVDVSDPRSPEIVDSVGSYGAIGVTIEESVLVEAKNLCLRDISGGHVRLYEVADPARPIEIGSVHHAGFGSSKNPITVARRHVFAAAANGSTLEIVSIDDPSNHFSYSWLNQTDWPDGFTPISLIVYEHYLYASATVWSGNPLLAIFDISDPVNPSWVNSFDISAITSMAIDNDKLYLAHGWTIDVYELTDPVNPIFMFSHTLDRLITDIDAQDNCVYAGTYPGGFYVFCTNDPVVTPTPSLTPTSTPTLTPTHTPSLTPTGTVTPTATPIPPLTPTATPSSSPTNAVEQRLYLPLIHGHGS